VSTDNQIGGDGQTVTWLNAAITAAGNQQSAPQNGASTPDLVVKQEAGALITHFNNEKTRLAGGGGPQGTKASGAGVVSPNVGAFYGV
jgi:hypothetical protein